MNKIDDAVTAGVLEKRSVEKYARKNQLIYINPELQKRRVTNENTVLFSDLSVSSTLLKTVDEIEDELSQTTTPQQIVRLVFDPDYTWQVIGDSLMPTFKQRLYRLTLGKTGISSEERRLHQQSLELLDKFMDNSLTEYGPVIDRKLSEGEYSIRQMAKKLSSSLISETPEVFEYEIADGLSWSSSKVVAYDFKQHMLNSDVTANLVDQLENEEIEFVSRFDMKKYDNEIRHFAQTKEHDVYETWFKYVNVLLGSGSRVITRKVDSFATDMVYEMVGRRNDDAEDVDAMVLMSVSYVLQNLSSSLVQNVKDKIYIDAPEVLQSYIRETYGTQNMLHYPDLYSRFEVAIQEFDFVPVAEEISAYVKSQRDLDTEAKIDPYILDKGLPDSIVKHGYYKLDYKQLDAYVEQLMNAER